MSLKTGVEVLEWMRMSGNLAVKRGKEFQSQENTLAIIA